ncbi:porin [Vogesella oryzae]|uniref:porin n=1 Tax=Vogesella oryzae TaxID=1735285 RepID=UPI00158317B6|nr:porin [Vogesella oryzae]
MNNQNSKPLPNARKPLAGAIIAALALSAMPAQAETEIEALKRQLAEQGQLIQTLLKQQESQQQAVSKIEQKVATAPAAAPGFSLPQGVTFYGVLDGGIESISNVKNGSDKGTVTRMPGITGTLPSRLGVRLSKELTPGLRGIATLETGFNLDNGTLGQSGRIFGRQLFAGVDSKYGSLTIGRQYSMLIPAMDSDLLGPNIYALGSLDAYLPNARYDNSLAWRGKFGDVSLGAIYSLARDTTGGAPGSGTCAGEQPGAGSNACRGWSAMAKYDNGRFGVAAAYDQQRGGTGATVNFFNGAAPVAFTRPEDSDTRTHLGGFVKFGSGGKLGLGWLGRKADVASGTIKSDTYYLEGAWQYGEHFTFDGGYHWIRNKDQDRNAELLVLRAFYNVTPEFSPYLQFAHISNSAKAQYAVSPGAGVSPEAGSSQTATMVGMRYRF